MDDAPFSVPPFVVGCWQLSTSHRGRPKEREQALAELERLVDAGFTTFDCADIYGGVEEMLGELLGRYALRHGEERARRIRVHTKFVPDRSILPGIDRGHVESIVDRSRRRLGRDALDLVQFHWWDYEVPGFVETALWLEELRREGRIRHLGVTNFDAAHLEEILRAGVSIVTNQVQYSVVDRRPRNGMARFCENNSLQLLAYGTLLGGLLSERFLGLPTAPPPTNRSQVKYGLIVEEFGGWGRYQELLRVVDGIARKHRATMASVALRFVLDEPRVGGLIVGASSAETMDRNRRALELPLDEEDRRRIRTVTASRGPNGDIYELERVPGGKHSAILRMNLNREP